MTPPARRKIGPHGELLPPAIEVEGRKQPLRRRRTEESLALGSGEVKHDSNGVPAPMKPGLLKFVLATDITLLSACVIGVLSAANPSRLAVASYVFAAGCLIGAAEGVPNFIKAVKNLIGKA